MSNPNYNPQPNHTEEPGWDDDADLDRSRQESGKLGWEDIRETQEEI